MVVKNDEVDDVERPGEEGSWREIWTQLMYFELKNFALLKK